MSDKRPITLDDVAQFDSRVQLAVLDAVSRVYAAGLTASSNASRGARQVEAREAVDHYLTIVAPLILGSNKPD